MWEKFSFFGMRALLVYYMVKHLHFEQGYASLVYGTYAAGVYLTPILGAYISDRWLGKRRAIVIGSLTMAVGHFLMAFEPLFYVAMVTIAVGNGLFLPNLPSQVGQLYERDDPRRQSAYSIYYLGVNLGAFFAPLVCGTLGELYGWHYGFGAAGIGMCVGLAIYLAGSRYLPRGGVPNRPSRRRPKRSRSPSLGPAPRHRRSRSSCFAPRTSSRATRWPCGSTPASIARFGGQTIPATWFQSLNPLFVFLLTPLVVAFWNRDTAPRPYRPGALRRMSLGAFGVALSYLLLGGVIAMAGAQPRALGRRGRVLPAVHARGALHPARGLEPLRHAEPQPLHRHDDRRVVPRVLRGQPAVGLRRHVVERDEPRRLLRRHGPHRCGRGRRARDTCPQGVTRPPAISRRYRRCPAECRR